eukprot:3587994-Alexandrium_andersonii.AAC.1
MEFKRMLPRINLPSAQTASCSLLPCQPRADIRMCAPPCCTLTVGDESQGGASQLCSVPVLSRFRTRFVFIRP